MYLNAVYFGEGAYGAEAASRTYFSKHGEATSRWRRPRCSPACRSSRAGSTPTTTRTAHCSGATIVLAAMLTNGYITEAEYEEALRRAAQAEARRRTRRTASTARPTSSLT